MILLETVSWRVLINCRHQHLQCVVQAAASPQVENYPEVVDLTSKGISHFLRCFCH
jgi:hypothetical protein